MGRSAALFAILIMMTLAGESLASLKVGFYNGKCGKNDIESIVFSIVKSKFIKDPTLVAALLRMQFHDCFVRCLLYSFCVRPYSDGPRPEINGCDASLLLDGRSSEKTAPPNGSVRGYEVIDAVKAALERVCPGVVSCADIIAIATRVSVVMAGGRWYNVETGRRDGRVSLASDANANLPGPTIPVRSAIQAFAAKGIGKEDLVLLLGGHTVGIAHCSLFQSRLYSFNGVSGRTDPSMSPSLVPFLKRVCPRSGSGANSVFLDQSSPKSANVVDNGFYKAIVARKGILQIDQMLALDPSTKSIVSKYAADNSLFQVKFGQAMVKLGRIGVLTGSQGQIRKSCHRVK
ncbi:hypothetical protein V2J09_011630 [Rumex salicifolius]